MLDYIVMQMRKTNREKGYWDRCILSILYCSLSRNGVTLQAMQTTFSKQWKCGIAFVLNVLLIMHETIYLGPPSCRSLRNNVIWFLRHDLMYDNYLCPGRRPRAQVIICVGFFYLCPGRRPRAQVIICVTGLKNGWLVERLWRKIAPSQLMRMR